MKEKVVSVGEDVLWYQDFEYSFELVDAHAEQVDRLDYRLDHLWLKSEYIVMIHQHLVHNLKDDVLHRREVERLDNQFDTVLDAYPEMDLFPVWVLNSQHQI